MERWFRYDLWDVWDVYNGSPRSGELMEQAGAGMRRDVGQAF